MNLLEVEVIKPYNRPNEISQSVIHQAQTEHTHAAHPVLLPKS